MKTSLVISIKQWTKVKSKKSGFIFILTITFHHPVVVVKFPKDILRKISTCKDVVSKMSVCQWFNPADIDPSLEDVAAQIEKVEDADIKAGSNSSGTAAYRNSLLDTAIVMIFELRDYVQKICNANLEHALDIAQLAGMDLKKKGGRGLNVFKVEATGIDGQVKITGPVKKGIKANHEFQVSTNPGDPKLWYEYPITVTK